MHTSTFEIISIILVMSAFILGVVFLIYSNLKSYIDELSEKITILYDNYTTVCNACNDLNKLIRWQREIFFTALPDNNTAYRHIKEQKDKFTDEYILNIMNKNENN